MLKVITLKKITANDIIEMLLNRMEHERRFFQSMIRLSSSMGNEPNSLVAAPLKFLASDEHPKQKDTETRWLLHELTLHPWDRLRKDLDFWIGTQVGVVEDEYTMLPWLERAKKAETVEEALRHISDMNDALGDVVPASLDLTTDRWADVSVERVPIDGIH